MPRTGDPYTDAAGRLTEILGGRLTAALLGVSASRPGAWARGVAQPSPENRARLEALDELMVQVLDVLTPRQARLWFTGHDPVLGARPLDVFRIDGPERILPAIKAVEQGASA